jgi:Rod binding domain-containing protein
MQSVAIETMRMGAPGTEADKARRHAAGVAEQFEELFVRTLVGSLRQTSSMGGSGGMFGDGPGASTYADWFDQNVAEQITKSSHVGIADQLMRDFERSGEIAPRVRDAEQKQRIAAAAAQHAALAPAMTRGGTDVVL